MKTLTVALSAVAVAAACTVSFAQPPGPPGGGPGGDRGGFRPPAPPLMVALDADGDGELSADEIANASKMLKKLDKDGNGRLSREEMRPEPPQGGDRGGRGRDGGGPDGGGNRAGKGSMADRLMAMDKNGDGKLSKDEAPEWMQGMFDRLDTNGDGFADKAELEAAGRRFAEMRGGRGGEGAPGGNRGPRDGGDRAPRGAGRPPADDGGI